MKVDWIKRDMTVKNPESMSFNIPQLEVDALDFLSTIGVMRNRSEGIRVAIRRFLLRQVEIHGLITDDLEKINTYNRPCTATVPRHDVEEINRQLKTYGLFFSRSELVRMAILSYLVEEFLKLDIDGNYKEQCERANRNTPIDLRVASAYEKFFGQL